MAISAGSRLGGYEILSLLGEGGMGRVYRARDSRLQREVAIKVLPDSVACDPERVARFERDTGGVRRFTADGGLHSYPVWNPTCLATM